MGEIAGGVRMSYLNCPAKDNQRDAKKTDKDRCRTRRSVLQSSHETT